MFTVDQNGIITMTRGDSIEAPLFINSGTGINPVRYHLSPLDVVTLYIMLPNTSFEKAIIAKEFTSEDVNELGDVVIALSPNETLNLRSGKYYYEIRAYLSQSDEINTIIPKTLFYLID